MASIREIIEYYHVQTEIEGCSITPLYYLFSRYISDDSTQGKLLEKLKSIGERKNVNDLVLLTK